MRKKIVSLLLTVCMMTLLLMGATAETVDMGETGELAEATVVETAAPAIETEAPVIVTETPVVVTEAPVVVTEAPVVVTGEPEAEETPAPVQETIATEAPATPAPDMFRKGLARLHSGASIWTDTACREPYGIVSGRPVVYVNDCASAGNLLHMGGNDVLKIIFNMNGRRTEGYVRFKDMTYLTADETATYGDQPGQGITVASYELATVDMLTALLQEFVDTVDTAPQATVGPLVIGSQPADVTVYEGEKAAFSVKLSSGNLLSYAWYVRTPGSTTWSALGANGEKATLWVTADMGRNGNQYYCVISDGVRTVASGPAVLTVRARHELKILSQPAGVQVREGESAAFTIVAQGDELTYRWECCAPGSNTWNALTENGEVLTLAGVDATQDGMKFRCVVEDIHGGRLISGEATLSVRVRFTTVIGEIRYTETEVGSGELYVEAYYGSAGTLEVLGSVEAMPVVEIGPSAFENNTTLTSITLPDTIRKIGRRAFAGCSGLKEMN